jgi:sulfur carrier protein
MAEIESHRDLTVWQRAVDLVTDAHPPSAPPPSQRLRDMITVNGDTMDWRDGMTVAEILEIRNYIFRMIAVQVNGELVPRGTYGKAVVPDGADVQVIHMISGG